jgi:chloramphenicol-sensitive protein RarD
MNKGLWYAVGAYVLWGVLPLYWKALQTVPAIQIVGHRMVWSLIFVGALFVLKPHWSRFYRVAKNKKVLLIYFAAGSILFFNWFTYVWAVNAGYVVETALGYFTNPLVYVLLGVLLLRERLRLWQWVAVASAAGGVLYLTVFTAWSKKSPPCQPWTVYSWRRPCSFCRPFSCSSIRRRPAAGRLGTAT